MDGGMDGWADGCACRPTYMQHCKTRIQIDRYTEFLRGSRTLRWTDGHGGVRKKQQGMLGWFCFSSGWAENMCFKMKLVCFTLLPALFLMSISNMISSCCAMFVFYYICGMCVDDWNDVLAPKVFDPFNTLLAPSAKDTLLLLICICIFLSRKSSLFIYIFIHTLTT